MQPEARSLLHDIAEAIELIFVFTEAMDWSAYSRDAKTRAAVEREFITIGEAVRRLTMFAPGVAEQIPDARMMINFRNVITHNYDKIEDEVVWGIINRNLRSLNEIVMQFLQD